MLSVTNVSCRYGDLLLFEHVNVQIKPGERLAIVGPNGAGKTSLLRIMSGEQRPHSGSVSVTGNASLGFLRQGFADMPTGTLRDLLDGPLEGLYAAQAKLEDAAVSLADPDIDPDRAADAFAAAQDGFDARGGYETMSRVDALLDRFGLAAVDLDRPLSSLSGGQKTRAGLAALLARRPDVLLLDEPTNHLDQDMLSWLADFIAEYQGAVVMVSHDRAFLDDVANATLNIDPVRKTATLYAGNYSDFRAEKEHEEEEAAAAWHRQQVEIDRIERDIRAAESKARSIEHSTIDFAVRKKAAKIARPAVVRKKKLERQLASEEAAEKPEREWAVAVQFQSMEGGARDAVTLTDVSVSLSGREVLHNISLLVRHGDRIALTGSNGSGKTTLIRLIQGELKPDTGTMRTGSGVKIGYFAQEQQILQPTLSVLEQIRKVVPISETEIRTELHKFLFAGDTVHRRVADLSYGERARLMLAMLVLQKTSLLLLDEPLNHLDIGARESFEAALMNFSGTMIMVLHDRYAIDRLATREVEVRGGRLIEHHRSTAS